MSERLNRLAARAVKILRHGEKRSPRVERTLLAVALVIFVAATWSAWTNLPEVEAEVRWWLFGVAAAMVVVSLVINAAEFSVASHLLGRRVPHAGAFHVSVLSSAANILPIPGAVVVKARALRQQGQTYRSSLSITAAVGVMWVALAFVVAGGLQMLQGTFGVGTASLAVGIAGLAFTWVLLAAALGRVRALRASLPVGVIEAVSVVSAAVRIWIVLAALGYPAPITDATALALAAIVASAIGIFPGGLGIRELLSAGIAGLVGLDPAVGLVVSAVDRILTFVVFGSIGAIMLATGASQRVLETTEVAETEPEVTP